MSNIFKEITEQLKINASLQDLHSLTDDELRDLQWILHSWVELSISEMEHRQEKRNPQADP